MPQLMIIASGKKKGSMEPPPAPPKKTKPIPPQFQRTVQPPPPPDPDELDESSEAAGMMDEPEPGAGAHELTPKEVGYAAGNLCGSCEYMGEDGSCSKYNFPVTEDGHCEAGYEAKGGEPGAGDDEMAA